MMSASSCSLKATASAVPTLAHLGGHGIDHVLGRGMGAVRAVERPERGRLSDHAAVIVEVA